MDKRINRQKNNSSSIEDVPMFGRSTKSSEKDMAERNSNFEWLANQNLNDYKGHWISIRDRQIIASGLVLRDVLRATRKKYPDKVPFVVRVPETTYITV